MKNQGIIYYGSDQEEVLESSYKAITEYLQANCPDNLDISKHLQANTYPNFLHIKKEEAENEISIEKSRSVIDFLSQKPTLSGNRAVLIENCEKMSRNAANSILKILEEPPMNSIIVLTTTKIFSILPTIRSRCLKFKVNSKFADQTTHSNALDFSISLLKDLDESLISKFYNFINSKCQNAIEFSKQNAENFLDFLKVALAFCAFKSTVDKDLKYSKKLLKLQEFQTLFEGTYPDKQSAIVAICTILNS